MNGKRLLIVDDEKEVLELLNKKLTSAGYQIIETQLGQEAVELAKAQKPDLILLDIVMPDIDGGDVVNRLRDDPTTQKIPIIFLSGIVHQAGQNRDSYEITVSGQKFSAIPKPFNFEYLLGKLRKILQ